MQFPHETNEQSKPPTWGGTKEESPKDGIYGNRKSRGRLRAGRQNGINYEECQAGKFRRRFESSAPQKELIPFGASESKEESPRRNLQGIFIPEGDPSRRQKEINYGVPVGQFIRRDNFFIVYNFYVDPSWLQKEIIPKCQTGGFRAGGTIFTQCTISTQIRILRRRDNFTQRTISTQIRVGAKGINSEMPAGYFRSHGV